MASYCLEKGKDKVIFVNEDDYYQPMDTNAAKINPTDEDEEEGLIKSNGEINWDCPCLGGMATGPCGPEFREAFSCFHYSVTEMKGSDCVEKFQTMSECMAKYPDLYPEAKDDEDEDAKQLGVSTTENSTNTTQAAESSS